MSNKALNFVFERSKTQGSARVLMLAIADAANDEGWCWPGKDSLHKKVNVTKRQLIRLIQHCERMGELRVEERKEPDDPMLNDTNAYYIVGVADSKLMRKVRTVKAAPKRKKTVLTPATLPEGTDTGDTRGTDTGDTTVLTPATPGVVVQASPKPSIEPSINPNSNQRLSPVGAGICFFKFEDFSSNWDKTSKTWADPDTIYIGKGVGARKLESSKWVNPIKVTDSVPPDAALRQYKLHVLTDPALVAALPSLIGKTLVWADEPNHAPVLIELVEAHLSGVLPGLVEEATATVIREQKTVRNYPNRQLVIEAVARHIFTIADPTRIPDDSGSIIAAFEKSIHRVMLNQFGLCNFAIATRSVERFTKWMDTRKRGLPRYVSGFEPDYIAFIQQKDKEIRAALAADGTPATTSPVVAGNTNTPHSRPQTLEEALDGLREYSAPWKKAKAEFEARQKGLTPS